MYVAGIPTFCTTNTRSYINYSFKSWTIAIFTGSSNSRSTENDEALNYDYTIAARPWIERVCSARNSHYTDFFWQENAEMNALLSRSSFQVIAEREKK